MPVAFSYFLSSSITFTAGVANIVQVPSAPFRIAGVNTGDKAGFSLANAGDVKGSTLPVQTSTIC